MRQIALGVADGSGAFQANMRESDPTRGFLRSEPVEAGTGLGRVVSIAGGPGMMNGVLGLSCPVPGKPTYYGRAFCYGRSDNLTIITAETNIGAGNPWGGAPFDHLANQY